MKTVGIVGGTGPESTIEYYRFLVAGYRERVRDGSYPRILIHSIDLKRMLDLIGGGQLEEVTAYLLAEVQSLARAGADFGVLAANTPHVVFDELAARSPIPMVSLVEATRDAALAMGLRRIGIFGTRFTMEGGFYPDVFEKAGIEIVRPSPEEQTYIHDKYVGELLQGLFLPETRAGLLAIAKGLRDRDGVDAVILGGTELPLILRDAPNLGIPLLDTTRLHVDAIVSRIVD